MPIPNEYIGTRETAGKFYYQFRFECPCGYFAELGVPQHCKRLIHCPECGNLFFMQRPGGLFASPRLISVLSQATARA